MSDLNTDSKKRGLGRGLGSLLSGAPQGQPMNSQNSPVLSSKPAVTSQVTTQKEAPTKAEQPVVVNTEGKVWKVSIEKIKPGIYQPRRVFVKERLEELSSSIKQSGILQPIVVRKKDEGFEIIAGERRWRAAQMAGLHEVPVIIKNYSDKETLELSIVENIQREDLSPIEEAEGYYRLMNEFSLSHQQIAEKVGRDRSSVTNAIRLLSLPVEIKKMVENSDISVGHAKILLGLENKQRQLELANICKEEKISVRKLEKMAAQKKDLSSETSGGTEALLSASLSDRLIAGLGEEVQKLLGTRVNIDYNGSKGKVSIYFYSDEELTNIIDKLRAGCQN